MATIINRVRIGWREHPIFYRQRVIEIDCPIYNCPNGCTHVTKSCKIYAQDGITILQEIPNPVDPVQIITLIIKNYFPIPQNKETYQLLIECITQENAISDDAYTKLNLNHPHPNIIVFRGDMTHEGNFPFLRDMLMHLDKLGIGMFIGADSLGSMDQNCLPFLLRTRIIDEIQLKLHVPNVLTDASLRDSQKVLNSFSQAIAGLLHIPQETYEQENGMMTAIETPDLKNLTFSFLFSQHSSLDVFYEYLSALYNAIDADHDADLFHLINIALRGDGTESPDLINTAYDLVIKGFDAERVFCIPIPPESRCLYYDS